MQRIPSRTAPRSAGTQKQEEPSPMLRIARRIREEQGAEQVRAFLAAMLPFAAPNEIRRIGEGFGIPFESIESLRAPQIAPPARQSFKEPVRQAPFQSPVMGSGIPQTGDAGIDRAVNSLNMIRTVMQLKNAMAGGADPMKLMGMLNGR
ncbi:MAG: hypothetical protein J5772_06655 [Clostridia bacterium]|nr:hypothetical protein [Clostridia bacterium]